MSTLTFIDQDYLIGRIERNLPDAWIEEDDGERLVICYGVRDEPESFTLTIERRHGRVWAEYSAMPPAERGGTVVRQLRSYTFADSCLSEVAAELQGFGFPFGADS